MTKTKLLVAAIISSNAWGLCLSEKNNIERPSAYINAVVESLISMKSARSQILKGTRRSLKNRGPEMVLAIKLAAREYECAAQHVGGFTESENPAIQRTANSIKTGIDKIIDLNQADLEGLQSLMDGNAPETGEGTKATSDADRLLAYSDAYEIIATAVVTACRSSVLAGSSDKTLLLTSKRRSILLEKLYRSFGKKKPNKNGEASTLIAHLIIDFLNQDWKMARDEASLKKLESLAAVSVAFDDLKDAMNEEDKRHLSDCLTQFKNRTYCSCVAPKLLNLGEISDFSNSLTYDSTKLKLLNEADLKRITAYKKIQTKCGSP